MCRNFQMEGHVNIKVHSSVEQWSAMSSEHMIKQKVNVP